MAYMQNILVNINNDIYLFKNHMDYTWAKFW